MEAIDFYMNIEATQINIGMLTHTYSMVGATRHLINKLGKVVLEVKSR